MQKSKETTIAQWRSNLAGGFLLFMLFDDSMMNILKLLPYDRLSFC